MFKIFSFTMICTLVKVHSQKFSMHLFKSKMSGLCFPSKEKAIYLQFPLFESSLQSSRKYSLPIVYRHSSEICWYIFHTTVYIFINFILSTSNLNNSNLTFLLLCQDIWVLYEEKNLSLVMNKNTDFSCYSLIKEK